MQSAKEDIKKALSRPFILIYISLAVLLYCILDFLNPMMAVILGFSAIGEGDILGSIISLLKVLLTPELILKAGMWIAVGIIVLSILAGLFFSGILYVLHNALEDSKWQKGEFVKGIKEYTIKISLINIRTFTAFCVFVVFISIVSIPSLFVTWSWRTGKSELFLIMIFLNIVTAAAVFFSIMFFRIYAFYWYPSAYYYERGAFLKAKKIVDEKIFSVMGKLLLFDIVFMVFEGLFIYFKYRITLNNNSTYIASAALFTAKLIFLTIFSFGLSSFIFASFKNIIAAEKYE